MKYCYHDVKLPTINQYILSNSISLFYYHLYVYVSHSSVCVYYHLYLWCCCFCIHSVFTKYLFSTLILVHRNWDQQLIKQSLAQSYRTLHSSKYICQCLNVNKIPGQLLNSSFRNPRVSSLLDFSWICVAKSLVFYKVLF